MRTILCGLQRIAITNLIKYIKYLTQSLDKTYIKIKV